MKQYPIKNITIPRGETIAYRETGSGTPLVLIHGNMSSSVFFQSTMEALEDRFHIIVPDMRGFGDSTYNSRFDSLHDLALDMEEFFDAIGLTDPFFLLGWSTGGGVALEIAADRPKQVKKVILLDSVPTTGYPIFKKDANGQPILNELLKTKEEIAVDPVQVAPVLEAYKTGNRDMLRAIWDMSIYNLKQPPAEIYEKNLDAILQQRNLVDIDYALLTFNMTDVASLSTSGTGRINQVLCPIIILQGELDLVVPLAWAQAMQDSLGARAQMITFPNAGHSVITDDPELFFTTLRTVLV